MTTKLYYLVLLLILLTLTGCSSIEKIEQPIISDFATLSNENTIGQTYVARYDGLDGFLIYVEPEPGVQGVINLQLSEGPGDDIVLRTATLDLAETSSPGYIHFQFSPIKDSTKKYYYVHLQPEMETASSLRIGTSDGDSYINGAMYQNQIPQDAQIAFNLSYDPIQVASGLLREGLIWILWILVGIFLYIIPGWALLGLLWSGWVKLHWGEKLGLSAGVSLAIYPIIFLWTHLIGLNLDPLYAWIPPIVGVLIIIWNNRKDLKHRNFSSPIPLSSTPWADITLLFVIVLIFAVRFWVIRGLDAPMWGDSYQHTMIAQLLVDNNGLFNSWEPYAELTTFTYHFGFHTLIAVFHWVTGLSVIQSVLGTGQILNGLAVIGLFPLAARIGKNKWAGIAAIVLAGLLFTMPMYYVNWGRYTQLAGLAILPAAVFIAWTALDSKKINWGLIILSWIVLGGLALTHYRVIIFASIFYIAYLLVNIRAGRFLLTLWRTFLSFLGAFLIFLPWFIHVFSGRILNIFSKQITTLPNKASTFQQQYNTIGDIFVYLPSLAWIILPVFIGWGLWRREKGITLLSLWWFLILLATNPQWLNLPGAGAISNFAVFISSYIPVSIIIGSTIGWLVNDWLKKSSPVDIHYSTGGKKTYAWSGIVLTIMVLLLSLLGFSQRMNDLEVAKHSLVTRPDLLAAARIREEQKTDTQFLVNSMFAYGDSRIVGTDGGWWLPLLTLHQTTQPPINYGIERGPKSNYHLWINALAASIRSSGINDPKVLEMLNERGITHVYIGQKQGSVNSPSLLLDPDQMNASPHYNPIYHQDLVWIFEINPD
ncbi:hypothetical protein ACFLUA_01145 [Chloroflexota bacterium]